MESPLEKASSLSASGSGGGAVELSAEEEALRRLQERASRELEEVRRIRALRYYQHRMQREARTSQQQKRKLADGEFVSSRAKEAKTDSQALNPFVIDLTEDGPVKGPSPCQESATSGRWTDQRERLSGGGGDSLEILTWNINGLDEEYVTLRMEAAASIILETNPAAVLLQEVTDQTARILVRRLNEKFHFFFPSKPGEDESASCRSTWEERLAASQSLVPDCPYYCAVLINKEKLVPPKRNSLQTLWFPGSRMYRHLMYGVCCLKISSEQNAERRPTEGNDAAPLLILTSHLESMWNFRQERIEQLKCCFKLMRAVTSSDPTSDASASVAPSMASAFPFGFPQRVRSAIFAGDFNLRDRELLVGASNSQGAGATLVPGDTFDAFEYLGKPPECMYTWDQTKCSDNGSRSKSRCRFDRVYVTTNPSLATRMLSSRGSAPQSLVAVWEPVGMRLVGTKKLSSDAYPSDHFGVLCSFKKVMRPA